MLHEQLLRRLDGIGKFDFVALLNENKEHFARLAYRLRELLDSLEGERRANDRVEVRCVNLTDLHSPLGVRSNRIGENQSNQLSLSIIDLPRNAHEVQLMFGKQPTVKPRDAQCTGE